MDKDLKAKWVAALRSGKYKQGHGKLRSGNAFCCLGVLCEVAGLRIAPGGVFVDGYDHTDYEPIKSLIGERRPATLYSMNDNGSSFREIADYIEAHL